MFPVSRILPSLAFLGLVSGIGCSGVNPNAQAKVNGKITYKGAPIPAGSVLFEKEGSNATSEASKMAFILTKDGTYSGTDLPDGEYTVVIETDSAKAKTQTTYKGKNMMQSSTPKGAEVEKPTFVAIPKKYNKRETSGLKASLKKGNNEANFDLND